MLNNAVNRVANGRRFATRRIVMNTLATIAAQVYRKEVVYRNPEDESKPADPLSYEALTLSQQDEAEYTYQPIGHAYILFDKFQGGYLHKNNSMINPDEIEILAQIELYDETLATLQEKIFNLPDEQIKEGDILGLSIYNGFLVWFEVVNITGQTMMSDFGTKYLLNRRDDLLLDPIEDDLKNRVAMIFLRDLFTFTRGQALSLDVRFEQEDNHQAITIHQDMEITAHITNSTNQKYDLNINILDQAIHPGAIKVESEPSVTSQWHLGHCELLITLKENNQIVSEQSLNFTVIE